MNNRGTSKTRSQVVGDVRRSRTHVYQIRPPALYFNDHLTVHDSGMSMDRRRSNIPKVPSKSLGRGTARSTSRPTDTGKGQVDQSFPYLEHGPAITTAATRNHIPQQVANPQYDRSDIVRRRDTSSPRTPTVEGSLYHQHHHHPHNYQQSQQFARPYYDQPTIEHHPYTNHSHRPPISNFKTTNIQSSPHAVSSEKRPIHVNFIQSTRTHVKGHHQGSNKKREERPQKDPLFISENPDYVPSTKPISKRSNKTIDSSNSEAANLKINITGDPRRHVFNDSTASTNSHDHPATGQVHDNELYIDEHTADYDTSAFNEPMSSLPRHRLPENTVSMLPDSKKPSVTQPNSFALPNSKHGATIAAARNCVNTTTDSGTTVHPSMTDRKLSSLPKHRRPENTVSMLPDSKKLSVTQPNSFALPNSKPDATIVAPRNCVNTTTDSGTTVHPSMTDRTLSSLPKHRLPENTVSMLPDSKKPSVTQPNSFALPNSKPGATIAAARNCVNTTTDSGTTVHPSKTDRTLTEKPPSLTARLVASIEQRNAPRPCVLRHKPSSRYVSEFIDTTGQSSCHDCRTTRPPDNEVPSGPHRPRGQPPSIEEYKFDNKRDRKLAEKEEEEEKSVTVRYPDSTVYSDLPLPAYDIQHQQPSNYDNRLSVKFSSTDDELDAIGSDSRSPRPIVKFPDTSDGDDDDQITNYRIQESLARNPTFHGTTFQQPVKISTMNRSYTNLGVRKVDPAEYMKEFGGEVIDSNHMKGILDDLEVVLHHPEASYSHDSPCREPQVADGERVTHLMNTDFHPEETKQHEVYARMVKDNDKDKLADIREVSRMYPELFEYIQKVEIPNDNTHPE